MWPGALLVAGEDVADGRAARERVVERQDRPARNAEGDVDPLGLEAAEDRVGAEHLHAAAPANSVSRRAAGSDASRVVHELPRRRALTRREHVRRADAGLERVHDAPLQRAGRAALAQALAEHERGREQHRARVGDALAGDLERRAVRRAEHALAVGADPAGGDHPRALVGERGRARQRLRERLLAGDDVEAGGVAKEPGHDGLEGHAGRRGRPPSARRPTASAACQRGLEPTEVRRARRLNASRKALSAASCGRVVEERADHGQLAARRADARDPPAQVELGLDAPRARARALRPRASRRTRRTPRASRRGAGGRSGARRRRRRERAPRPPGSRACRTRRRALGSPRPSPPARCRRPERQATV